MIVFPAGQRACDCLEWWYAKDHPLTLQKTVDPPEISVLFSELGPELWKMSRPQNIMDGRAQRELASQVKVQHHAHTKVCALLKYPTTDGTGGPTRGGGRHT